MPEDMLPDKWRICQLTAQVLLEFLQSLAVVAVHVFSRRKTDEAVSRASCTGPRLAETVRLSGIDVPQPQMWISSPTRHEDMPR